MRNIYTILLSLLSVAGFAQMPNGGFENWTTVPVGESLDYWENSSLQSDSGVVTKSTDKVSGSFSVKLKTVYEANGDTTFGYFINGDPDKFTGGLPCTNAPDSIVGYYKYDIKPTDTALFLAIPKALGTPTSQALLKITGKQTTWKRFSIPFVYPTFKVCDSIIIAAASSNALANVSMQRGSWLMIDSIHFKGTSPCAIPNHSFENWSPVSYEDPNTWTSFNGYFAGFGLGDTLCQKTTDANTGSFAVQLNNIASGPKPDTITSQLHLGGIDFNNFTPIGVPFTQQPAYLNGYYKFSPGGTDTAFVAVFAKKSGSYISQDFIALTAASSYTGFSVSLNIPSAPDTVAVVLLAGNNPGSIAKFDDLTFSAWPVFVDEVSSTETANIYPNPTTGTFAIAGVNGHMVSVYSLTGKLIHQEILRGNRQVILPSQAKGMYLVKITSKDGEVLHMQKLNVIR